MKRLAIVFAVLICATPVLAADPPAPAAAITMDQVRQMMTGTWQNVADTRFTRQLNADGTAIDRYEGDDTATSAGNWKLYNGTALPPEIVARKVPAEGVYMTLSEHGDFYLFAITAISPQSMEMINIDRKLRMSFERLK